jgi:hypothetical protein
MAVFSSMQNTAACCGGRRCRPIVGRFAFELRIVAGQVTLQAVGFQASFFPDPMHCVLADSSAVASLRQLQCVEPSLGFLRVADRIRARKAGVRTVAFWPG